MLLTNGNLSWLKLSEEAFFNVVEFLKVESLIVVLFNNRGVVFAPVKLAVFLLLPSRRGVEMRALETGFSLFRRLSIVLSSDLDSLSPVLRTERVLCFKSVVFPVNPLGTAVGSAVNDSLGNIYLLTLAARYSSNSLSMVEFEEVFCFVLLRLPSLCRSLLFRSWS